MLGGDVSGWGDAAGGAGWTLALGEGTFGLRSLLYRLRIVISECVWGCRVGKPQWPPRCAPAPVPAGGPDPAHGLRGRERHGEGCWWDNVPEGGPAGGRSTL